MKKLSEVYTELGIDFGFPIVIQDNNGNETYYEGSVIGPHLWKYDKNGNMIYRVRGDGCWSRSEYNENNNEIHFENYSGFWSQKEYDENGNRTSYKDSNGVWYIYEYDENGKEIYFRNMNGEVRGNNPKSIETKVITVGERATN